MKLLEQYIEEAKNKLHLERRSNKVLYLDGKHTDVEATICSDYFVGLKDAASRNPSLGAWRLHGLANYCMSYSWQDTRKRT